jgi:hypothetical protein
MTPIQIEIVIISRSDPDSSSFKKYLMFLTMKETVYRTKLMRKLAGILLLTLKMIHDTTSRHIAPVISQRSYPAYNSTF